MRLQADGSCAKVRYATRALAKREAKEQTRRYGKRMSVYQCTRCGSWHLAKLTSARRYR